MKQLALINEDIINMQDEIKRDFGEQPIAAIMLENDLKPKDLVTASTEQISHKMVSRACKGRKLNPHVKAKVNRALNKASGKEFTQKELFNY